MKSFENFFNTSVLRMKRENQQIFLFTFLIGLVNSIYAIVYPVSYTKEFSCQGPILSLFERLHGGWNHPILLLLGFFFIAISIILLKDIFMIKRKTSIFLLTIFVTLFPVFHENTIYLSTYLGVVIAFLLAVYSLLFLQKKRTFLSILFMVIAFCIYPFAITIPLAGIFLLSIMDLLQEKFNLKTIGYYFITIVMGILLSQIIFQILSIFIINDFTVHRESFLSIFQNGIVFYFQNTILQNKVLHRNILQILLFIGLGIYLIIMFFQRKGIQKLYYVLSCILFITSICLSTMFSTRLDTCFGFLMFYILFFILIEYKHTIPIFRSICFIGILLLSFTYFISNQASYMSIQDQKLAIYAKENLILQKVKSLEGYQEQYAYFFSDPIYYESSLNKLSNRNYSYDFYYTKYYKDSYKEFFGENISLASSSLQKEILASSEYKNMKTGDIMIIHNVIVVKASDSCYYKKY